MDRDLEIVFADFQHAIHRLSHLRPLEKETPEGITPAELKVIMTISIGLKHFKEVRPSMIADYSNSTKSALSQTLKSLEKKGFIQRSKSEKDSRAIALLLTEKGQEIAAQAEAQRKADLYRLVEHLDIEEMTALTNTVNKIHEFYLSEGAVEAETSCKSWAHIK